MVWPTKTGPLEDLIGHSTSYWIAMSPRAGQTMFTLQTVAPRLQGPEDDPNGSARTSSSTRANNANGMHCHAGRNTRALGEFSETQPMQ